MDQETVSELESRIEQAITEALAELEEIPPPSPQTLHLMAKGAVAVYEAETPERAGHHSGNRDATEKRRVLVADNVCPK